MSNQTRKNDTMSRRPVFAEIKISKLLSECERIMKICPRHTMYDYVNTLTADGYQLDVALAIGMKKWGLGRVVTWVNHGI